MTTGVPVQIIAPGPTPGDATVFNVDAVLAEGHKFDSRTTKFPVEDGTAVGDNIWNEPITVTLTCIVTNSPVRVANAAAGIIVQNQLNNGVKRPQIPALDNSITGEDLVQDAFDNLLAIRDARQLVTIITGLKRYPNMAMGSWEINRDRKTGQVLQFSVPFSEFQIAGSQTITYPNLRSGKTADQGEVRDAGKQSGEAVDEFSSFARDLRNGVKSFRGIPLTPAQAAGGL